jgi:hypothetical protein
MVQTEYFKIKPPPYIPPKKLKWAYRVEEANGEVTQGRTNFPGITTTRIATRDPRQITLERL